MDHYGKDYSWVKVPSVGLASHTPVISVKNFHSLRGKVIVYLRPELWLCHSLVGSFFVGSGFYYVLLGWQLWVIIVMSSFNSVLQLCWALLWKSSILDFPFWRRSYLAYPFREYFLCLFPLPFKLPKVLFYIYIFFWLNLIRSVFIRI